MKRQIAHTNATWMRALNEGRITVIQALYYWTELAEGTHVYDIKRYSELVREYLPQAEWLPEGVPFQAHQTNPVYWHSPADFYKHVNRSFGEVLELGEFLHDYMEEKDPGRLDEMVSFKQKQADRNAEIHRLREVGMTQQEIADEVGIDQATVSRVMQNSVMTQKAHKEKRVRITYQISNYTKPETAAAKIRKKFGNEFADALKLVL